MSEELKGRRRRADNVNALIVFISWRGRKFFRQGEKVACFSIDGAAKNLFYHDEWADHPLNLTRGNFRVGHNFNGGGTMRALVSRFGTYIDKNKQLSGRELGPWPGWMGEGDLWGYGKDVMAEIRAEAEKLGVKVAQQVAEQANG